MARLTPRFSADRTVREYTEQHYIPAATAYRLRIANKGAIGRQMVDWQHGLEQKWATLRLSEMNVKTRGEQHLFEVHSPQSPSPSPWKCGRRNLSPPEPAGQRLPRLCPTGLGRLADQSSRRTHAQRLGCPELTSGSLGQVANDRVALH
jgi:hypothetical protein